jgi:CRISPR-associated protein Cas1
MQSVIIADFGTALGKTSERLVVRGPRPRLELVEGGPQLLLPLELPAPAPPLRVVTSEGVKTPARAFRRPKGQEGEPPRPKLKPEQVELPLFRISEIVVAASGVSLSTDLIEACCERGIRLSFLTAGGRPYAMLSSPMLTATVLTRREQMAAYGDRRGVEVAKAVVRGKLTNQANLLKYFGKYLKAADSEAFRQLSGVIAGIEAGRAEAERVTGERVDDVRATLMGVEGAAGRLYWTGVKLLLGDRVPFETREHRGAADPVNSALNYGYGILYTQVWGAIMNAGLEPFAGFLHVDRPGKPSLVLDLIEEFRQPIVDRAVIASVTKGAKIEVREGMLTEESRRGVAAAVLERLEGEVGFRGQRYRVKSVIQIQARSLAGFLRGDGAYRPFAFKW